MIEIRELTVEDWRDWRELRLQALADAPYAFGSRLADWQGDRDSEERWRGRLAGNSYDLIATVDGVPAGMASGMVDGAGPVELISMWVAPFARGQRVADALVDEVAKWAAEQRPGELVLEVVESNARAVAFYRRIGFVDRGVVDPSAERVERWMARPV
ncbi:MAG TPA: GNAT family N-acetyltransferase [Mycobacteriales bacterium]|nr:GNAT family N-acetyltransferase [Mycobacteriales bacterium]